MKVINRLAFILGLAGTLLLAVLFWTDLLSIPSLVMNGISVLSLFAAGTALILLEKAPGFIKFAGSFCAWAGFIALSVAAYKFIGLSSSWNIGISLLAFSLLAGISHTFGAFPTVVKWIGIIAVLLLLIAVGGILFRIEKSLLYSSATAILALFSVVAIASAFVRSKVQD